MSFTFGVFDVFTYAATGSLYVSCLAYALDRLGWIRVEQFSDSNTTVLLLGLLLVSYLLGHMAYWLGEVIDHVIPGRRDGYARARERFILQLPTDRGRRLANLPPHLLLGGIEIHAREASQEVTRLRAVGLALRNASPAMLLAAIIAVLEVFASERPLVAGSATVLFLVAAWAVAQRGRALRAWAVMKTLELAYWIPEIDAETDG